MKLAIDSENSSYADVWVDYCKSEGISYEIISIYNPKLMHKTNGITHYLTVPTLSDRKTCEYAKSILRCIEQKGIRAFPNQASFWHYDDKVAQKYLLESIDAPLVQGEVFYSKREALQWVENEAAYPFVFKLKAGAGSSNVKLIRNKSEARKQVNRMFGRGEDAVPSYFSDLGTKVKKTKTANNLTAKLKRAPRTIMNLIVKRLRTPRERGYFYVQEFLPSNEWDTRITVVGERAYGFRRFVRPGDFRASGSGSICWDHEVIDIRCVEIALKLSMRLGFQCMAYDFINDINGEPKVVEISYNFVPDAVNQCSGHWDGSLNFIEEKVNVQKHIMEVLIND